VIEEPCFLLSQDEDAPGSVGEAFKHESRVMADYRQRKGLIASLRFLLPLVAGSVSASFRMGTPAPYRANPEREMPAIERMFVFPSITNQSQQ
jgi:hypothetical protein